MASKFKLLEIEQLGFLVNSKTKFVQFVITKENVNRVHSLSTHVNRLMFLHYIISVRFRLLEESPEHLMYLSFWNFCLTSKTLNTLCTA